MFCTRCGDEIKDSTKFCGNCGVSPLNTQSELSSLNEPVEAQESPNSFNFKKSWLISTIILTIPIVMFLGSSESSGDEDFVAELLVAAILAALLSVGVAYFMKWRKEGYKATESSEPFGDGRSDARSNVTQGFVWMVGGLAFTGISYVVADAGGTYFIAWGAVIIGGLQLIRGLAMYHNCGGIPRNLMIWGIIGLAIVGSIGYLYYEDQKNKLSVLDLKQGDCFSSNKSFDTEATELATVDIVSCSTGQWDYRVDRIFSLTVSGSAYPGQSVIDSQAESGCPATTDTFFFPTTESWGEGDRSILCLSAR